MQNLVLLYEFADKNNVEVYYYPMQSLCSMSFPDGTIAIDIDKLANSQEETICLAHEIGHIQTFSFYNSSTPLILRNKLERRADSWAINNLVPFEELKEALEAGILERWELAELFNVTEKFLSKAVEYYQLKEKF